MAEKKHNPFKLRDFRGVEAAHIEKLAALGIKNAEQMLSAGRTKEQRAELAKRAGLPQEAILELVKLSDLARLPGVKGIRARLYYDAGVDSVEKFAASRKDTGTVWEPEPLRLMVTAYMERTGFEGVPPLPKEVSSTIANARKLPKILED